MKIFLDTADSAVIQKWLKTGILDGVTTNPTLLSMQGENPTRVVRTIAQLMGDRFDVSVEVTEIDPEAVYVQAKTLAALAPNIVVKIPCAVEYYPVIKRLVAEGIALNITLVFSLVQGLAMSKLGVAYISPFVGRLQDIHEDGIALIAHLRLMIDTYGYTTQILAASIRDTLQFDNALLAGADIVTLPPAILAAATSHELTEKGMQQFLADWQQLSIKKFP